MKLSVPWIGKVGENHSPIMLTMTASMNPTIGPLDPTSNKASLFGGRDFCIITAPKVPIPKTCPIGGGPGMKYGGVASMPFLFAVSL